MSDLSDFEKEILNTPIRELTNETLSVALQARDKVTAAVRKFNETFKHNVEIGLYIVSDEISPILNHANGKMYDSKSKYYADLKRSGHIVVESGMDKPRDLKGNFDARKDVAKALNQLGY